jgi:hypothetical protein
VEFDDEVVDGFGFGAALTEDDTGSSEAGSIMCQYVLCSPS